MTLEIVSTIVIAAIATGMVFLFNNMAEVDREYSNKLTEMYVREMLEKIYNGEALNSEELEDIEELDDMGYKSKQFNELIDLINEQHDNSYIEKLIRLMVEMNDKMKKGIDIDDSYELYLLIKETKLEDLRAIYEKGLTMNIVYSLERASDILIDVDMSTLLYKYALIIHNYYESVKAYELEYSSIIAETVGLNWIEKTKGLERSLELLK